MWVSRDSNSDYVEIRKRKPRFEKNDQWFESGETNPVLAEMSISTFKKLTGLEAPEKGECYEFE